MPKDPSSRSLLSPKSQGVLYNPYSSYGRGVASSSKFVEESEWRKEWEEATCPICMEHPHNAVLLICTSHDKGCRPYICDTSYRHSNCLDQYRKAHESSGKAVDRALGGASSFLSPDRLPQEPLTMDVGRTLGIVTGISVAGSERSVEDHVEGEMSITPLGLAMQGLTVRGAEYMSGGSSMDGDLGRDGADGSVSSEFLQGAASGTEADAGDLLCPLCRGKVEGWRVVDAARQHLNCKIRTCAQEACGFSGPYEELRKHARGMHPSARPSDVDPARQRDWRRLERQRDLGDVLSTIQSAMPGATVLGDYVIDGDDEDDEDEEDGSGFPSDEGNWWTVFLLCQVFGPSMAGGRGVPSRVRGRYRHYGNSLRGPMWGENLQGSNSSGTQSNGLGTNANVEGGTGSTSRRRRSRHRGRGDVL